MNKVYLFKYGLTVLLLVCAISVFAQTGFSGKVVDETNQPLGGATIHVKGTQQATSTDANGKFSFPANNQSALTLEISFVGYDVMEKMVSVNTPVTIQLIPNQRSLNEVVVVGYGTTKRSDVTGAVAVLTPKDLNPGTNTNPLQQLAGRAPGVDISQVGSEPGVAPSVRIRGITSLEGGNDPLVVVDGVQGDMTLLNQVPSTEIASISILKDASATAQYGSRGAAGVILITTKRSIDRSTVEVNETSSLDVVAKHLDVLNAAQWTAEANKLGVDPSANHGANTDWYDLLSQNGFTENHNLAFGGGTSEFNYRASITAINQTGVVINSSYRKFIGTLVATQKALDDKLTLTFNLNSGINDATYSPPSIGNAFFTGNLITDTYFTSPTEPVFDTDGSTYYRDPNIFQYTNPYAVAKTITNQVNMNNTLGALRANLDIFKGLSGGWFGSWRKTDGNTGYYLPAASTVQQAITDNGDAHINNDHTDEKLMDINLTYKDDIGKSHFDVSAYYEYQHQSYFGDYAMGRDFQSDVTTYNALQLGNIAKALVGDITSYRHDRGLVSYFALAHYSYDDKYLLSLSFRRDGSTVFGVNNKWGNFPSAEAAWKIDQETFMKEQDVVSTLKLRAAYGETGNQQGIQPNSSEALVGQSGTTNFEGTTIPVYSASQNANPNLKWETDKEADLGLDFGFFHDRLTGTIDAYDKHSDNLLYYYTVPTTGIFEYNTLLANLGSLQNEGIELALSYDVIKTKDVRLTLAGNGTLMQNKVLSLGGDIQGLDIPTNFVGWGGGGDAFLIQGKSIGTFKLLQQKGVDANGAETYVDVDKNGTIDNSVQSPDRTYQGQSLPKYTYAFTPSFTYKNFDASMVWIGSGGNKVYDRVREDLSLLENLGKANVLTSAPALGISSAEYDSNQFLESGSYLRFANLTFGYKFDVTNIKYISAFRVSVTGQNLALITKYKGGDPEVDTDGGNSEGQDYGIYPRTRTFSVGLNVVLK